VQGILSAQFRFLRHAAWLLTNDGFAAPRYITNGQEPK